MKLFSPILLGNADMEKSQQMSTFKSFLTRAISAIIAVGLIGLLYFYWDVVGLKAIVVFASICCIHELGRILFHDEEPLFLKILFSGFALLCFAALSFSLSTGALVYCLASVLMIVAVLLRYNRQGNLQRMASLHARTTLGLFYVGLLPAFCYRILDNNQGVSWFVYLLSVVFAGDTVAYLTGVMIGKHKVMPSVSPKKTWEGSVGGLIGSMSAGILCWLFLFPEQNLIPLIILAALAGFVGQFGDFFESLLKRVAEVKDSGRIMPGHGGVLDRLDALLFAGPVVLGGILWLTHFSV